MKLAEWEDKTKCQSVEAGKGGHWAVCLKVFQAYFKHGRFLNKQWFGDPVERDGYAEEE